MSRLFETIKIKNREFQYIEFHNDRFNKTRMELFGLKNKIFLQDIAWIPEHIGDGIYKCRIFYDDKIRNIEFEKYEIKEIRSLKLVECNDISYSYKYSDRSAINALYAKRASKDDVLIIKKGYITDTSYANVILWMDERWVTPSRPLLAGTTRSRLIKSGLIMEDDIKLEQLHKCKKLKIINAMIDINNSTEIFMDAISL